VQAEVPDPMTRYMVNRLLSGLLTMFLFVTLLFFLVNLVVPGDFVSQFIMTGEDASAMRERLGLDRPLWAQYLSWLGALVGLDLGTSFTGDSVWGLIVRALPSTVLVLAIGLGLAFALGGWLGRFSGYRGRSVLTGSMTFVAIVFLTAFPPALAFAMEHVVRVTLRYRRQGEFGGLDEARWLVSELNPSQVLWRMVLVLAATLAAVWAVEAAVRRLARRRIPRWPMLAVMVVVPYLIWRVMGLDAHILDLAGTMVLIVLGVLLLTFGDVLLVTRAAMDDVMLEDYVMAARARGLSERRVRDVHAARPALLPVLSRFTVSIPYFLTGLVILEAVFAGVGASSGFLSILERIHGQPGLGTLIFNAVRTQDTPVIVGSLAVVGVLTLLLRIALDVIQAALDPRIRFGETAIDL
jgi:peptide/nickel transport system permease protein